MNNINLNHLLENSKVSKLEMVTGYAHPGYAESLAEFGAPRELSRSGGWILKRQIPGFPYYDAMGCYPLFACYDWSKLHVDLEEFGNDLVSLSVVTDPFGEYDETYLKRCFQDVVIPFKEHFIIDLSRQLDTFVCKHHRRYSQKALRTLYVERCSNLEDFLEDLLCLYKTLIDRHEIRGIAVFSRSSFAKQLRTPGIVAFRAVEKDTTVGMLLWSVQGEVAHYHLGAHSARGYELRSSFALFWYGIEYFAEAGLSWLNLGAGAGVRNDANDGLSRFKDGWSTGTRTAYFCGRIFNDAKYSEIVEAKNVGATDYFPAYRVGEFAQ